jgi:two-component system sensor histidine kinase PilS (NtrC family)
VTFRHKDGKNKEQMEVVYSPGNNWELNRNLLELITGRFLVLLLGLNLADPLGLLPEQLGTLPFLPFFNILSLTLTLIYLILWWIDSHKTAQLYFQIGVDLILATLLVAHTQGIESAFISFYILIIIYCSLTLGRNGGIVGAALSTILYAGVAAASHLKLFNLDSSHIAAQQVLFRISAHFLGFWAVAYLGTHLHKRVQAIEWELKKKIDSLTQLQRLNKHIISSIRSGLITTDLEGRVAVFNGAAKELMEKESGEVIDSEVQLLIGKEFWRRILEADLFRSPKPLRHEDWIVLHGGKRRFLGYSVSPLVDQSQKMLGYIISFQDLTEIKRLEEEVRLKDRMAAIGRMAAGIAHEIRNPLTSMRGSVEILRSHTNLSETDERLFDILIRESDRLNEFVEDFLNFARPRKYSKQSIDLIPVLRDSVTLLRNSPEIRGKHSVVLDAEARIMRIHGNADQLKQVFWNLALNAIRAMPNGGALKIRARKTLEGAGQIAFQDTGVGMTQQEKEQIFQPFHSGFKGGLGLGFSIIFQIMEDHQGKISIDSEPGKGTEVSLWFPQEIHTPESDVPVIMETSMSEA